MRKNSLYLLIGLLAITFAFTSCLDSNTTEYELSPDAAITAFSVGDITMTDTIKTKDGKKDSTIYYTVPASSYKFSIDQQNGRIFNSDSLPVGTKVDKLTTSLSYYGYYVTYLKNDKDTLWTDTDSIDFTRPLTFKAYALNGSIRQYQIEVRVHQQDPDSLQWTRLTDTSLSIPENAVHKAVCTPGKLYIFTQRGESLQVTSSANGTSWSGWQTVSLPGTADYTSVTTLDGQLYILADNKLYLSDDGVTWTAANTERTFDKLFAASPKLGELYALSGNELVSVSADGTQVSATGTANTYFPTQNLSYAVTTPDSNTSLERLVVVGTRDASLANDTTATVWAKLSNEPAWSHYPQATNNTYGCPKLKNLAAFAYDGKLYAFGGSYDIPSTQTPPVRLAPFQYLYESMDGGISWHPQTEKVMLPKEFLNRTASFSYVVDEHNFIWVFWSQSAQTNGQTEVWRGRINRLGF